MLKVRILLATALVGLTALAFSGFSWGAEVVQNDSCPPYVAGTPSPGSGWYSINYRGTPDEAAASSRDANGDGTVCQRNMANGSALFIDNNAGGSATTQGRGNDGSTATVDNAGSGLGEILSYSG